MTCAQSCSPESGRSAGFGGGASAGGIGFGGGMALDAGSVAPGPIVGPGSIVSPGPIVDPAAASGGVITLTDGGAEAIGASSVPGGASTTPAVSDGATADEAAATAIAVRPVSFSIVPDGAGDDEGASPAGLWAVPCEGESEVFVALPAEGAYTRGGQSVRCARR